MSTRRLDGFSGGRCGARCDFKSARGGAIVSIERSADLETAAKRSTATSAAMFKPRSRVRVEWDGEYYDARVLQVTTELGGRGVTYQRLQVAYDLDGEVLWHDAGGPNARSIPSLDDGDASWDKLLLRCDLTPPA